MKTIELKAEGRCLNAALYEPACAAGEKYPLVLFLHGAGERGDDIEKVLDFTPGVDAFTAPAWQAEHPCFVLAPQCPAGRAGCRTSACWPACCTRCRANTRSTSAAST